MGHERHPTVRGFRFAGVTAGLKDSGRPDLGLILADRVVPTSAVLTRNRVRAAPVQLAAQRLEQGRARAVLVNSGSANACTGKPGLEAARETTQAVAEALDLKKEAVLPASTGVIGAPLSVGRILDAVPSLVADLSPDGVGRFAEAIRTTDRGPKIAFIQVDAGRGEKATVLGVAKGAGMIHPSLATTLAFVVTDAPMSGAFLNRSLRQAADETFNAATVDGETSTNDAIFAMASGALDAEQIRGSDAVAKRFRGALVDVLGELARSVVRDGEGARKLVRLEVVGAPSQDAARKVAERVARSLLVKTAVHGGDPNWGRIVAAAGMADVAFEPDQVEVRIGTTVVCEKGVAVSGAEGDAARAMAADEYPIRLKLGSGKGKAHYWLCDIGHDYVTLNSEYTT
jgi:glutamate N-acetyltransferase/amino-acid N-acetyltransferase